MPIPSLFIILVVIGGSILGEIVTRWQMREEEKYYESLEKKKHDD